jgi:hypothetical protein
MIHPSYDISKGLSLQRWRPIRSFKELIETSVPQLVVYFLMRS